MNRRTAIVGGGLGVLVAAVIAVGFLIASRSQVPLNGGPTPAPTPTEVKVEVERAYLAYWEAYTQALLKLDAAPFEDVTTGEALETSRSLVQDQAANNQPVRVRVEHNYRIAVVRDDFATVDDTFISHSVRLDPQTQEPIEPDPKTSIRNSYTLRKVGGRWKVSEIIGYESPSS